MIDEAVEGVLVALSKVPIAQHELRVHPFKFAVAARVFVEAIEQRSHVLARLCIVISAVEPMDGQPWVEVPQNLQAPNVHLQVLVKPVNQRR